MSIFSAPAPVAVIFFSLFLAAMPVGSATTVTLYGAVDSNLQWGQQKYAGAGFDIQSTRTGLSDGYLKSNIWGLKGTEQINPQLTVFFNLENKFSLSEGTSGGMFNKKSFVGVRHERFGSLSLGRQKSSSDEFLAVNQVRGLGKISRAFGGAGVTSDNLFKYRSPDLAGWSFGLSHARKGSLLRSDIHHLETDFEHYSSIAAAYAQGPWQVSASYDRKRGLDENKQANDYTLRNWTLGSVYDFGAFKLSLAYGRDVNGKFNKAGNLKDIGTINPQVAGQKLIGFYQRQGFKSRNYYLGVSIPWQQMTWAFSWTRSSSNMGALFAQHTGQSLATGSQHIYAGQLTYPLSKRTTAYVYGAYGKNLAYLHRLTAKEVGIGLSHRF